MNVTNSKDTMKMIWLWGNHLDCASCTGWNMLFEEMARLAHAAARAYKRSCWWADTEDLEQSAWVAMCEADRTFDESVGVEKGAYFWDAIIKTLKRELLRESSPVSASSGSMNELKGLIKEPVDEELLDEAVLSPALLLENLEREKVIKTEFKRALVDRLDRFEVDVAMRVLIDEQRPRQISKAQQIPVKQIYTAVRRARATLQNDLRLWEAVREYR